MDTVFAVSTVQGAHCMQANPGLLHTWLLKCTFCLVDSSNYDTTLYCQFLFPAETVLMLTHLIICRAAAMSCVCITAIDTSEVYAGGTFDSAGVIKANNIARWNGTNWIHWAAVKRYG